MRIASLHRYPVKGLSPEPLDRAELADLVAAACAVLGEQVQPEALRVGDRIVVKPEVRSRIADSIETALKLYGGKAIINSINGSSSTTKSTAEDIERVYVRPWKLAMGELRGFGRSILNGRVREKRRFATQQFSLERMKTLAKAADCTINDLVLATCGGALRRFLDDSGDLPETALAAGIPVSVRPKDDENTGNAITFIIATLGTDIADPLERLQAIRRQRAEKAAASSLPRDSSSPTRATSRSPC